MPQPPALLRHTTILFCLRVLSIAANAALYVSAARWQGALSFGQITSWAGIATVIAVAVDCGTAARATRAVSDADCPVEVGDAVKWRLTLLPVLLCGFGIAAAVPDVLPRPWTPAHVLLVGLWGWLITVQTLLSGVLIGLGRTTAGAALFVVDKLVALALFAVISRFTDDALVAAMALPLGAAVGILPALRITLPTLTASLRVKGARPGRAGEQASFFATAMGAQVQNLDVPIVSWLAGPAQAGLLAAPSRLTSPIGIVASSVASILFVQRRHMMPATGPGVEGRPRAGATVGITAASAGLTAVIVSPLLVAPSWTMSLLLGSSYQGSGVTARLVAIGMCISALVQPLSADLQARHRHRSVAVSLLLAGLVGTLTVVLAAPTWGAVGGGVGVVMTQITAVAGLTAIRFRERLMIERCGDRSASSYPPDDQAAPAVARTAGLSPRRGVLGDGASPRRRSSR